MQPDGYIPGSSPTSLVAFDIDLTNGTLTLQFDDVVLSETLYAQSITLFSQPLLNSTSYQLMSNAAQVNPIILAPLVAVTEYNEVITEPGQRIRGLAAPNDDFLVTFKLGKNDIDNIKISRDLATSISNTFIRITEKTVLDIYLRNVTASSGSIQLRSFIPDLVRPNLVSFTLNLTSSIIKLSFDEPIDPSFFMAPGIVFQNNVSSTLIQYRFSDSTVLDNTTGRLEVELQLGYKDANALKSNPYLATNLSTAFIRLDSGAFIDQNNNLNQPISLLSPIQVVQFTQDTSRPRLIYFDLNLNDNYLSLYFDEAVNPTTLNISAILLQNSARLNESTFTHTLSLLSLVYTREYDGNLFITLHESDQLVLKNIFTPYAKEPNNTFISLSKNAIRNYNNLQVLPVSSSNALQVNILIEDLTCYATQAAVYVADTTPPILEAFEIDINTGLLALYFNETVNHTSLSLPAITLLDAALNPTQQYKLRFQGNVLSSMNSENLTVLINSEDLIFIKANPRLFTSPGSSQLSFSRTFIQDMSDNFIDAVTAAGAIQARMFQGDDVGPVLLNFSFDLNSGMINLTFDEPIELLHFSADAITLQNRAIDPSQNHTLQGMEGTPTVTFSNTVLSFSLLIDDINSLKSISDLATSIADTFLSHTNNLIRDLSNNIPSTILSPFALFVSSFFADITPPSLIVFQQLDLNLNTISLQFNEPVNASSLSADALTIHASQSSGPSIPLTGGTLQSFPGLVNAITILLNEADIFSLKNNSNIATSTSDTFLSTTSQLIKDASGVMVNAISQANALQPFFPVFPDRTGPTAVDCGLNLNTSTLSLTFDDPVEPSTLDLTKITLHRTNDGTSSDSYTFSDFVVSLSPRGYSIEIPITTADFNNLKAETFVAIDASTTHISMLVETIRDLSNNPSVSIGSSAALTCSQYTPDSAPPRITSWTLDMDSTQFGTDEPLFPTITIDFSETVKLDSLDLTTEPITLVGLDGQAYNLTGGEFVKSPNSPELAISLTVSDTNRIKELLSLATYINNSYLAIRQGALVDLDDNPLQPISLTTPLIASQFTPDRTPSTLLSFDLDMNIGRIVLTFDETVNGTTLDPTTLILQHTSLPNQPLFTLTGGNSSSEFDTVVYLNLTISDLNEIKRLEGLSESVATTYLTLGQKSIQDVLSDFMSNYANEIFGTNPLIVSNFTFDTTRPNLVRFSLNLTSETLHLTFDETVCFICLSCLHFVHQYLHLKSYSHFRLNLHRLTFQIFSFNQADS